MIETHGTYAAHSQEAVLVDANRAFLDRQPLAHVRRFLDLACGPGTIGEILLARAPGAHYHGIDADPAHVALAADRFTALGYAVRRGYELTSDIVDGRPVVTLAVGSADDLPFPEAVFDCVTITNAIHLLPDKRRLVEAIARVLRPGGLLAFNSAFYAGTLVDGTHAFYHEWIKSATVRINEIDRSLKAEGKAGLKRVRGTTRKAFQNRWFSGEEWSALLGAFGLRTIDIHERTLELDGAFFSSIGAYSGLAETLLSGYPVDVACEALQSTVAPALAAVSRTSVPRNWLELWARRD
ncbi:MAG: class I SAM-dependent methyltransferase [Rhodospirillales bacterium]